MQLCGRRRGPHVSPTGEPRWQFNNVGLRVGVWVAKGPFDAGRVGGGGGVGCGWGEGVCVEGGGGWETPGEMECRKLASND